MEQLIKLELELDDLERLLADSFLNEKSAWYCTYESDRHAAAAMLAEINKVKEKESIDDIRNGFDVSVFQPVHFWAFFFPHLRDQIERCVGDKGYESFIRLTIAGITIAKVPVDL